MNMGSRIEMRWSINPNDMGYGKAPAPEQLPGIASYIGTPRAVLAEVDRIRDNVGQGTYIRIEYRNRGRVVEEREIMSVLRRCGIRNCDKAVTHRISALRVLFVCAEHSKLFLKSLVEEMKQ